MLFRRDRDPEMADPAALLGEHQHARRIHAQVRRGQGFGPHGVDQRLHQVGQLLVPGAQGRLGHRQALAGVDAFEPVERLVVLPSPDDGVGQHAGAGDAPAAR
jgi:hypothetical protein